MSDDPAADGGTPGGDAPHDPGSQQHDKARPPRWTRLIAPLRSEDAAFRMVVWAAGAALVLAALVLLARLVS